MTASLGVPMPLEFDARTVRRGDEITRQPYTVQDMTMRLPHGGKRLRFATGETFTMSSTTVLWATRRITPRRIRRHPCL